MVNSAKIENVQFGGGGVGSGNNEDYAIDMSNMPGTPAERSVTPRSKSQSMGYQLHGTDDGGHTGYEASTDSPGLCAFILTIISYLLIVATFPFSLCLCIKVVQEYERAVIFRLGRLLKGGAKGPGIFFIVPCIDSYRKVDLRTVSFDVPPQEILTRDSVTISVEAVVYYRVSDPIAAKNNVEDYSHSTRLLAATTLRNVLGTRNLAEILSERESISATMQSSLDDATDPWGVKVERVEIKDVRLPVQLQRAMAAEAEAAREARAKVIAAEGEQRASRALKEAAEVINESPAALQLRYLQTLNAISAENNSTIIFPLPVDVLAHMIPKHKEAE
ncbi:band 7 protein AGAP004871-like isoform X10 [Panulirus ornatus]|uniref:band 7 protein AGAP004871-like isoform X10 n=1 Tax=Panulirus ornatus TaxID=150431 RepID=UPI003A847C16